VVLIHGAGANLEDMRVAVGDRLAKDRRIIFVDRPGFGFSVRGSGEAYSPAYQAGILGKILDQLAVERAIVVGHSLGGAVALTFALDFPQRVAGLVLIAPVTHPRLRFFNLHNRIFMSPFGWLFAHTLATPLGTLLLVPGVWTAFLPQKMPRKYAKQTAAWLILRPGSLIANWTDVGRLDPFLKRQVARYKELTAPTIALNGDRDPLIHAEQHVMLVAKDAPSVKVEILPGYGHMLHHAAADRVVAAVDELSASID